MPNSLIKLRSCKKLTKNNSTKTTKTTKSLSQTIFHLQKNYIVLSLKIKTAKFQKQKQNLINLLKPNLKITQYRPYHILIVKTNPTSKKTKIKSTS